MKNVLAVAALLLALPVMAADLWWAVSMDYGRHTYAAAWDFDTKRGAERAAIRGCLKRSTTGEQCDPVTASGKNSCFYIATWMANDGRVFAYSSTDWEGDPLATKEAAMRNFNFFKDEGETIRILKCPGDR